MKIKSNLKSEEHISKGAYHHQSRDECHHCICASNCQLECGIICSSWMLLVSIVGCNVRLGRTIGSDHVEFSVYGNNKVVVWISGVPLSGKFAWVDSSSPVFLDSFGWIEVLFLTPVKDSFSVNTWLVDPIVEGEVLGVSYVVDITATVVISISHYWRSKPDSHPESRNCVGGEATSWIVWMC